MPHLTSPSELSDWLSTWGYLGVFICVFMGNLGIPVPEETVLLAAGFLAGRGDLSLGPLYLVGGSAVTGDCFGFLFGRTGGQRVFERLAQRFAFVRTRYDRLQSFLKTHGPKAVFMARFVTGARFMAGPMAGAAGMSFLCFLGWNLSGALIWCSLIITIGYLVGDELESVAHVMHAVIGSRSGFCCYSLPYGCFGAIDSELSAEPSPTATRSIRRSTLETASLLTRTQAAR